VEKSHVNVVDAISQGASDGLRVALNVIAMLIGFLALVALLDGGLYWVGRGLMEIGLTPDVIGLDLSKLSMSNILGVMFSGMAWCMGVPSAEMLEAGQLMGTKLVLNEFVAYTDLIAVQGSLDPKTVAITSFALCGFANLGSIGMQVGGIGQLAPGRRSDIARLGFRALIAGTLASYLSATIAGILL
jgi:CNT family concentrative nucleoside transporter